LIRSASRIGSINSPDRFDLSDVIFLISRLPPILNEIPHFFFSFYLTKMISYLFSILKATFGSSIEPSIFAFEFYIYLSIFGFWFDPSIFDLSIVGRI
jgi:hypothetical protein